MLQSLINLQIHETSINKLPECTILIKGKAEFFKWGNYMEKIKSI